MSLKCLVFVFFLKFIWASKDAHYECGVHGKFEYCIDGIPGCVIGCHCHPGYFFDTETKICEPNIKLTQFRRSFNQEPTRVSLMNLEAATLPTPTTLNAIDERVNAIAKDTDDLGDWLYNQFFKTIENQVINNTEGEIPKRRSGSSPMKLKRRSRKKNKKSKRKHKKKGRKDKLLRITEDDSLFDSSSGSSSAETHSSSSESENENENESESENDSSSGHGHRKIIMINKKPKPPLPSFIFLPNVETPFFPPIGLPAPPILPMYPMVPVPPMGVMYPDDSTTTCGTITSSLSVTTSGTTETSQITKSTVTSPNVETSTLTESSATTIREISPEADAEIEETSPKTDGENTQSRSSKVPQSNTNKNIQRNKLMQKIKDKMKKRNKGPPARTFMETFQDPETSYVNEPDQSFELRQSSFNDRPKPDDVDFKYLSQLIHKIDLNKTLPKAMYNPLINLPSIHTFPQRRSDSKINSLQMYIDNNHKPRPASKADDVNDKFYTDLGKQIASLIRKVDSKGESQIDIEIQQQTPENAMQAIINENRFAPRSYWERFVRSPFKYIESYLRDRRKQNVENLINLENQVNMATTIERTLTLQELENIANIINTKTVKPKAVQFYDTKKKPQSNYNVNVSLLPSKARRNNLKNDVLSNKHNLYGIRKPPFKNENTFNKHNMFRRNRGPQEIRNNITNKETENRTNTFFKKSNSLRNLLKTPHIASLYQHAAPIVHKSITTPKPLTAEQMTKYQLKPILLNYKNINYVNNNRNKYHIQRSYIPFNVPYLTKQTPTRISQNPSYFHHELHHFDYFD